MRILYYYGFASMMEIQSSTTSVHALMLCAYNIIISNNIDCYNTLCIYIYLYCAPVVVVQSGGGHLCWRRPSILSRARVQSVLTTVVCRYLPIYYIIIYDNDIYL